MKTSIIISLFSIILLPGGFSQDVIKEKGLGAITNAALRAQTEFLASDWTEGRETGTRGEYLAADYIASMLKLYGVEPGGDFFTVRDRRNGTAKISRTYFQNFSLMTSSPGDVQGLSLSISENGTLKTISFESGTDFVISSSYPGGTVEAPVVFAGYGYVDKEKGYDDFRGLDVKGKIIIRLSGLPSGVGPTDMYARYRASSRKDSFAREAGAAAILEVNPANIDGSAWTPEPDFLDMSPAENGPRRQRVRYTLPSENMGSFVPRASISLKLANTILKGSGIDISAYAEGRSKTVSAKKGFNNRVTLSSSVNSKFVKVRNVIGVIEGQKKDEVIVIGAHYDHEGIHDGYIYNGADDNASGTVGVMTLARAIAATGTKPEKTIVFALWTGEERGLLGSKYYADHPTVPLESIRINVNFDMISRYVNDNEPNKVTMMYSPECPELKDMTIRNMKDYNIELEPDYLATNNPPGGTDHSSFINKGISYLRYKPGHREEYHTPADEVSTLDWDIMEKIVKLTFLNVWEMAGPGW